MWTMYGDRESGNTSIYDSRDEELRELVMKEEYNHSSPEEKTEQDALPF